MKYFLIALLGLGLNLQAQESFPEDQFFKAEPVIKDIKTSTRSNIAKVIAFQTPVKSQKSRGTCTIFTSIGLLEALLQKHGIMENPDLSEEWLEYIIMTKKFDEGSNVSRNFKKLRFFGVVSEETWPYVGKRWRTVNDSELAMNRCGHLVEKSDDDLPKIPLTSCLLGHRDPSYLRMDDAELKNLDPEFFAIREEARDFKATTLKSFMQKKSTYKLSKLSEVKEKLLNDIPVILGVKLYYGAWNHSKTTKLEIQKRDKSIWYKGIVGYPEKGSMDFKISSEKGGGHSLILVGFDDHKTITHRQKMEDGTWIEKTYTGVYYFKNSWGTRGFGRDFTFEGKRLRGYGIMPQKYAHDFGTFYHLPVNQSLTVGSRSK